MRIRNLLRGALVTLLVGALWFGVAAHWWLPAGIAS